MTAVHGSIPPAPLATAQCLLSRRITVGIVTFNAANVLERALASVLRYKSPRVELVVVDGASNDGTVAILERHHAQIDHWRSEPDAGIYDAMNKVRQAATGDWLLFLGADDELLVSPDRLLDRLTQPDALYYGNVLIEGTDRICGGRFSRYRMMQENICHQAILYPRSSYKTKAYDTHCGILADHRYNIELRGSGIPFIHVDETISRFNDAGRSSAGDPQFEVLKLALIRRSFGLPLYMVKRVRTACVRLLKA
jgi:glycosyltransferase involved in cell wall biosynthesis